MGFIYGWLKPPVLVLMVSQKMFYILLAVHVMVFKLDGCSFQVAHVCCKQGLFPKKNRIWWLFRCNQMPSTNRNAWITPCVRIVKWATIYYKNHGSFIVEKIWSQILFNHDSQVSLHHYVPPYTSTANNSGPPGTTHCSIEPLLM